VTCAACGHTGPAGARFCAECGNPLGVGRPCPGCGTPTHSGQKFCVECGHPLQPGASSPGPDPRSYTPPHLVQEILTSRSALEGERKHVTVLFVDVHGSMDLAGQLDPEAWHRILDRFFLILTDGVHRFEGSVNQYTGDGIMALFGAPIAHEDHAQRACYAALHIGQAVRTYADELRLSHGISFSVRMGLNSGEVIVGRIGDDLRMDYTAQGHCVGLAARMEQLAEPGSAYLTEHTAALVGGYVELRDLGRLAVRGMPEPVGVSQLLAVGPVRTRLDVARARGFSRFVGRTHEMALLDAAWAQASTGEGRLIGVVGEPGVGKSRLCFEFLEHCRLNRIPTYTAHAVPFGKMVPLLPVLELLRGFFGISDGDAAQAAREKIAGRLLLLDRRFAESLPVLFDFLGIPDPDRPASLLDAAARQKQLFAIVHRLVHARGERGPMLILIEDLHWLDRASEAFVMTLVDAVASTRGLLLLNFRPEYTHTLHGHPQYREIPLLPLGDSAVAELLVDWLGSAASLAGLADRIQRRTGGNPFYVEEVIRGFAESGALQGERGAYRLVRPVDEIDIPPTVQAVLAARIDRLGQWDKMTLQTAAVIGKRFSEPLLARVIGLPDLELAAALRHLVDAGLVHEHALFPEAEYEFKHRLTLEVAYTSQLADRRSRLHAAVATAMADLYAERHNERAAVIAQQWQQAGDALEAARWYRRAAEWVGMNDAGEAIRHWREVWNLAHALPATSESTALLAAACIQLLSLGWRLGAYAGDAEALFREGSALARATDDVRTLAHLTVTYGIVRCVAGDLSAYVDLSREAAGLAAQTGDPAMQLVCERSLAASLYHVGRFAESLAVCERALARPPENPRLGVEMWGFSPHTYLIATRGYVLSLMGRPTEGHPELERAAHLAREHDEPELRAYTYTAIRLARRAVALGERTGIHSSRVLAWHVLAVAHLLHAEYADAAIAAQQSLAISRERHTGLQHEAATLAYLAEARRGLGEFDTAATTADAAVALAQERGMRFFELQARLSRARVRQAAEGATAHDAILADIDAAQALVQATGGHSWDPWIRLLRADLASARGDNDAASRERRTARALFTAMGAVGHLRTLRLR
jgi:class 3 adenylate cyclase/tetratricopeptide (TPR) repeat protein